MACSCYPLFNAAISWLRLLIAGRGPLYPDGDKISQRSEMTRCPRKTDKSRQLAEQRLGVLQIGRIEAIVKLFVDGRQQFAGGAAPAVLAP